MNDAIPDLTDPDVALRRFFGTIWVMRIQVYVGKAAGRGHTLSEHEALELLGSTDPGRGLTELLGTATRPAQGDWRAVRDHFADEGLGPDGTLWTGNLRDMDGSQFAQWLRSRVVDMPVALAFLDVNVPAEPMRWLRAELTERGWLPSSSELAAGERFVLDYLDANLCDRVEDYLDELSSPITDPRLLEPRMRL